MPIVAWLTWLGETPWSIALHESQYMWPVLESLHVLTLTIFAGTAAVLDLRLLGLALTGVPVTALTARLLPWTRFGFFIMIVTGALLFYATPLTYYYSIFFRIKLMLLGLAGINVFVFHTRTHLSAEHWDSQVVLPRAARVAAAVSLFAWAGVIVSGRLIAYNWFQCDLQPQPAFINWAASCPITPP